MVDIEGEILSRSLRLRESAQCPAVSSTWSQADTAHTISLETIHKKNNYSIKFLMAHLHKLKLHCHAANVSQLKAPGWKWKSYFNSFGVSSVI